MSSVLTHLDPVAHVILYGSLMLLMSLIGRYGAFCMKQPGVLGELFIGIVLGNVCYFSGMDLALVFRESSAIFSMIRELLSGVPLAQSAHTLIHNPAVATKITTMLSGPQAMDWMNVAYVVDVFSRYGVIFLLFMVGLESSLTELQKTGRAAAQVALIGVVAPLVLGLVVLSWLMPAASFQATLFIAATLSATSVGITARVLKDLKKLNTREAKTILGAAMLDDVLGLMLLAIVSSMVLSGTIHVVLMVRMIVFMSLFFLSSFVLSPWLLRGMIRFFAFLPPWEAKLITVFLFVMLLSWLASVVQLSTIIGAFVAGLILHDDFFAASDQRSTHKNEKAQGIKQLMAPLEALFAPLFFMLIGFQVKLETFLDPPVVLMALGLIFAAVVGKLVCGWGARSQDNRLIIGIGMLPRGEVGLVFASMGKTMGVISDQWFSAIILMVIVTTMIVPPWLTAIYNKKEG